MAAPVDVPSDDQWHVRVGNEVKVLTLEQLDDLFRLEIIDSETKVWQPGMPEWLPLSVVAGMEDSAEAAPPPAAPAPPPPAPAPAPKFVGNKTQVGLGPKPGVAVAAPSDLPRPPVVVPSVTKQTLPFGAGNGAAASPFAPAPSALPQPPPPPSTRTPPRPNGPASSRPPPPSAANGARRQSPPEVVAAPNAAPPPPPPPSLAPPPAATAAMPVASVPSSLPAPPPPVPSAPPPPAVDPNALLRAYSPASVPGMTSASGPVTAVENFAVARPNAPIKPGLGLVAKAGLVLLSLGAALLTLQRNDLLGASARSLFGAPSPETPHGVRLFLASLPPLASPESLKPKPLPPRAAEPRMDAEPRAAQPARPAAPTKANSSKSKKPAKGGKAKPNPGK